MKSLTLITFEYFSFLPFILTVKLLLQTIKILLHYYLIFEQSFVVISIIYLYKFGGNDYSKSLFLLI